MKPSARCIRIDALLVSSVEENSRGLGDRRSSSVNSARAAPRRQGASRHETRLPRGGEAVSYGGVRQSACGEFRAHGTVVEWWSSGGESSSRTVTTKAKRMTAPRCRSTLAALLLVLSIPALARAVTPGDGNRDERVSAADVTVLLRILNGDVAGSLSADANQDGFILNDDIGATIARVFGAAPGIATPTVSATASRTPSSGATATSTITPVASATASPLGTATATATGSSVATTSQTAT